MLKPKLLQQEQGFTLVEVLVSILIATLFTATAMQAMVIATIFKAQARKSAEATAWIQQDLENVKRQAAQLKYANLTVDTIGTTNPTVLSVSSVDGFAAGDQLKVGTDITSNIVSSVNASASPPTLTLSSALGTAQSIDAVVVAVNRCKPTAGSQDAGYAKALWDNLSALSPSGTQTILGTTFTLTRTPAHRQDSSGNYVYPYDVLKLTYTVAPQSGGSAIATLSTEVIPDAAFQCP